MALKGSRKGNSNLQVDHAAAFFDRCGGNREPRLPIESFMAYWLHFPWADVCLIVIRKCFDMTFKNAKLAGHGSSTSFGYCHLAMWQLVLNLLPQLHPKRNQMWWQSCMFVPNSLRFMGGSGRPIHGAKKGGENREKRDREETKLRRQNWKDKLKMLMLKRVPPNDRLKMLILKRIPLNDRCIRLILKHVPLNYKLGLLMLKHVRPNDKLRRLMLKRVPPNDKLKMLMLKHVSPNDKNWKCSCWNVSRWTTGWTCWCWNASHVHVETRPTERQSWDSWCWKVSHRTTRWKCWCWNAPLRTTCWECWCWNTSHRMTS